MPEKIYQTGHGRVFLQDGGANPGNQMVYMELARMAGFTEPRGDMSKVEIPSNRAYNQFESIDETVGEDGVVTTSISALLSADNLILRANCKVHAQVHYGLCEDPMDSNGGWSLIFDYPRARFTSRSSDDQTALNSSQRAQILITGDISAPYMTVLKPMTIGESGASAVARKIVDVRVRDYVSCGDCGYESDGDKRIFAVAEASGLASPGLAAELLYTDDGGSTWTENDISTLSGSEQPAAVELVGQLVVVPSNESESIHYADLSDLSSWSEVTTGFVGSAGPNDIFAISATRSWLVGDGGYVYLMTSPANGVTVQSAGDVTSENLNAVHADSSRNVVAVGDNGAIIKTTNGGTTWALVTSPTVYNINTVWMRSQYVWLIGDDGGYVWYTRDAGSTWAEAQFPMRGQGEVYDISFARRNDSPYGFMVATKTFTEDMGEALGYIFRTIDGGDTWYQLPDVEAVTPFNRGLLACSAGRSGNFVVAGGRKYWEAEEAGTGDDGIILLGTA